jgi:hypothetical protein
MEHTNRNQANYWQAEVVSKEEFNYGVDKPSRFNGGNADNSFGMNGTSSKMYRYSLYDPPSNIES